MKKQLLLPFNNPNKNNRVYLNEKIEVKTPIMGYLSHPKDEGWPISKSFASIDLEKKEDGIYIKDIRYLKNYSEPFRELNNAILARELMKEGATIIPAGYGVAERLEIKGKVVNEIHDFELIGCFLTMDPAFGVTDRLTDEGEKKIFYGDMVNGNTRKGTRACDICEDETDNKPTISKEGYYRGIVCDLCREDEIKNTWN